MVVDEGSVRPGEKREMRLMKRVRFLGVFRPLICFSLGGVLGFGSSLDFPAVDGAREAVVATDQRD